MTCFPENVYVAYADRELAPTEVVEVETHLAGCEQCRRLIASLREESNLLAVALEETPVLREARQAWSAVASVGIFALARALVVAPPAGWDWAWPRGAVFFLLSQFLYAARWLDAIATGFLCVAALFLAFRFLPVRRILSASAPWVLLVMLAVPSFAVTRRSDHNLVQVAAGETLDDTLIAAGDTVRVEGTIQGDLIAFARRVEVKGTIRGSLITFSQTVDLRGVVEGSLCSLSQTVDLGGQVGRSLYAWAETVNLAPGSRVGFEVLAAGRSVMLNGDVSRGVLAVADSVMGRGLVGRDLDVYGNEVVLDQSARITGRAALHVDDKNRVKIPAGVVSGAVDVQESHTRIVTLSFYVGKLLGLAGALLAAWFAWRLAPAFFDACVRSTAVWWRSLGIGLAAAALLPIAIVLAAITRVGLPLGAIVLGLMLAALYLAKIVVGAYVGRLILSRHALPVRLALGLIVIAVVVELPLGIGAAASMVVLAAGMGAFMWELARRLSTTRP